MVFVIPSEVVLRGVEESVAVSGSRFLDSSVSPACRQAGDGYTRNDKLL